MKRSWLMAFAFVGVAALFAGSITPALAQDTTAQVGLQIEGQIVRTAQDHVVVKSRDNKEVTIHVNPQTKFLRDNRAIQMNELGVGTTISASYVREGDRMVGSTFTVAVAQPAQPGSQPGVKPGQRAPMLDGEVVKVVGKDQIVIRTSDGKEVMVYVNPETRFQLTEQGGKFTDVKPGTSIGVQYNLEDKRYIASQVSSVQRLEGQVVKVVGKDRVIIRTSDGKEVEVFIDPTTQYQLTAQGGTFTDVRVGMPVGVYYDIRGPRFMVRRMWAPR